MALVLTDFGSRVQLSSGHFREFPKMRYPNKVYSALSSRFVYRFRVLGFRVLGSVFLDSYGFRV